MNKRGGFIGVIIAAIIAGASSAAGAAIYRISQGGAGTGIAFIDEPLGHNAPTLQLKSLIPITLTPRPTVPPAPGGTFGTCEYPGNGPGLEGVQFDEPEILVDYAPKPPNVAGPADSIYLWAGDENSIVMGTATVKTAGGTQTYPISQYPGTSTTVINPQTGAPYDPDGKDNAGRPMFPALFLTDVTDNPANKAGDWQQGGTPIPPHFISGVWIFADKDGTSVRSRAVPQSKNVINTVWLLVPAAPGVPGGTAPGPGKSYGDAGENKSYYGTEIRWNVSQLPVTAGRVYRAQFMVHDGDGISDVAQGCVTIQM